MRQVKHLLEAKGSAVYSISPDASVLEAIRSMAERGIGALLVMKEDELTGIVTERDYARKVILLGHSSRDTPVASIMSASPICVDPAATVDECMRLCTDQRVRHLPVTSAGSVVGLVSIGDLVKAVIDDQAQEIDHLQRYIAG